MATGIKVVAQGLTKLSDGSQAVVLGITAAGAAFVALKTVLIGLKVARGLANIGRGVLLGRDRSRTLEGVTDVPAAPVLLVRAMPPVVTAMPAPVPAPAPAATPLGAAGLVPVPAPAVPVVVAAMPPPVSYLPPEPAGKATPFPAPTVPSTVVAMPPPVSNDPRPGQVRSEPAAPAIDIESMSDEEVERRYAQLPALAQRDPLEQLGGIGDAVRGLGNDHSSRAVLESVAALSRPELAQSKAIGTAMRALEKTAQPPAAAVPVERNGLEQRYAQLPPAARHDPLTTLSGIGGATHGLGDDFSPNGHTGACRCAATS